jgi:hypothetical protein
VIAGSTVLRAGPGPSYAALATVDQGDPLRLRGRTSSGLWLLATTEIGVNGWVRSQDIMSMADINGLPQTAPDTPTPSPVPTARPQVYTESCGNAYCGSGETAYNCPQDCQPTATPYSPQYQNPGSTSPFVSFGASPTSLSLGQCTTVSWSTENVQAVYYQGEGVNGNSSRTECPSAATSYLLQVLYDGTWHDFSTTVTVDSGGSSGSQSQPQGSSGLSQWDFWNDNNIFYDEFPGNLHQWWTWTDPLGNTSYSLSANPDHLRINVPTGNHDLYPGQSFHAPRLTITVNQTNFTAYARIKVNPYTSYQGAGILVLKDESRFVRLEASTAGTLADLRQQQWLSRAPSASRRPPAISTSNWCAVATLSQAASARMASTWNTRRDSQRRCRQQPAGRHRRPQQLAGQPILR